MNQTHGLALIETNMTDLINTKIGQIGNLKKGVCSVSHNFKINKMKIKNKIQNKINDLEQEVEQMEKEVTSIVNSKCGDWSRVTILVNGMNIIANQIEILRGLY